MRLYVIERTLLADLAASGHPPSAGDRVIFLRDAQDLDGRAAAHLRARGVDVLWGPDLLDDVLLGEIDRFLDAYLKRWFVDGEDDVTRDGDLSLGQFLSGQLASIQKPPVIVTFGEICRRVLPGTAKPGQVVSDVRDGETIFANQFRHADISPRRRLLKDLAAAAGWDFADLAVSRPLPPVHRSDARTSSGSVVLQVVRTFLGGLRPRFLFARLAARRSHDHRPGVYVYFNHGLRLVAASLVARGLRVYGDQLGVVGVTPLRYDHLLALPPHSLRRAARRMRLRLDALLAASTPFTFAGFDYGPYLLPGIAIYLRRRLPADLFRMGQSIAMLRRYGIKLTIINGDTAAMYAAMGYARRFAGAVVHIDHGLNMFRHGLRDGFLNQPHVAYVAHGQDHLAAYGDALPEGRKPRRVVLGNPATVLMNGVAATHGRTPDRRVLLANYTPHYANNSSRLYYYDRYMSQMLEAARILLDRGFQVSMRPHHGEDPRYLAHMAAVTGVAGRLAIDTSRTFEDALARHDVFVANTTSCIYQALYAGWPTIFFDPQMKRHHFIGLPAAADIDPPLARMAAELVSLVEEAVTPGSRVARFPELFRTTYADRFITRNADRADEMIADFVRDEVLGLPARRAA